ncbi:MAG: hypothetical protein ACXV8X_09040 [Candidatus Angelobacter sp.]
MMKAIHLRVVCAILIFAALSAPFLRAQQDQGDKTISAAPSSAPVPAQILSAKKVFIAYGGGETNFEAGGYSGNVTRTYDQFYAALKGWGHYELVSDPADAELVFEISFAHPLVAQGPYGGSSSRTDPQFKVAIADARTRILLWTLTEHIELALMQENRDKNFDQAMVGLVNDVAVLAGQPPVVAIKKKKNDDDYQPFPN